MTFALLLPIVAASFLGSLHCAGMCGPFVATYAGLDATKLGRWRAHAAYHLGRLLTYVLLGATAGGIGHALDLAGTAAGISRVSAILSGALMMVWALSSMLATQGVLFRGQAPSLVTRVLARWLGAVGARHGALRALLLGLTTTLLPCGWLYAFALGAAGSGSIASGGLVMAAFWVGSVPLLLAAGVGFQLLSAKLRQHVPLLSAGVLLVSGLAMLVTRINLPSLAAGAQPSGAAAPAAVECPLHSH